MKRRIRIAAASLMVAAGLTAAVAAPATSAPQGLSAKIMVLPGEKPCDLRFQGAWKPVAGQALLTFVPNTVAGGLLLGPFDIEPDTTKFSADDSEHFSQPAIGGKFPFELLVQVWDSSQTHILLEGRTTKSLPCWYQP